MDLEDRCIRGNQNIRNLGAKRYFNRVELDGFSPDIIEDWQGAFEENIPGAISSVIEDSGTFHSQKKTLCRLMALFSLRNPGPRKQMEKHLQEVIKMATRLTVGNLGSFENFKNSEAGAKIGIESEEDFEQLKNFALKKDFNVNIQRTYLILMEMRLLNDHFKMIYERDYHVLRPLNSSIKFVTSDNPVVLNWNDPSKVPPFFRSSPGFGLKNTYIFFPLSSQVALLGLWDQLDGLEKRIEIKEIARFNTIEALSCNRFVYYQSGVSSFLDQEGTIISPRMFIEGLGNPNQSS